MPISCACQNNAADKKTTASSAVSVKPAALPPPVEIADSSTDALGQKALDNFAKGDFDAFISVYRIIATWILPMVTAWLGKPIFSNSGKYKEKVWTLFTSQLRFSFL